MQAGSKLADWLIPLLPGGHQSQCVDVVALPHHSECLNLLEQVSHSVPQGSVQGLLEGLVRAVQQLVPELDIIYLII